MTPAPTVAIVGMACRYPDVRSPGELWENVLAQRSAFRRLPAERMRPEDYLSPDRGAPDRTYVAQAALIEGYEFDRVAFKVAGTTFRAADLAHWLALDVASQALADAGFPDGAGLPRETSGVLLGNTLTGEFSRANNLRLRWPYVRRVVDDRLVAAGWSPDQRQAFLADLEARYKAPFPPVGEETLAGNLSNTIAGRICNHFDLNGGGYTVDGACASSLLAVATACSQLVDGDLDVALAGGVDLSLDPSEIVGFAKAGALAPEKMLVYDAQSGGFWPGEGCGFVVLMRQDDAVAQGRGIYGLIRGWGISSDGSGGITRPEAEGQLLAVRRAYRRAGFGADTVAYFEGHGTGTAVGDATELQVLSRARTEPASGAPAAAIGTIKANIGHTKAAAGVAGLIKATLALYNQILPPTTGCDEPHPLLADPASSLRALPSGEPWPADGLLRAAVSAMGFGGINTHVVLEGTAPRPAPRLSSRERSLIASYQDAELFLFSAATPSILSDQLAAIQRFAARLSVAELADLAAACEKGLRDQTVRAAIVASTPEELAARLQSLQALITSGQAPAHSGRGVFLGSGARAPRLGYLFPGQGSPAHLTGGAWSRRFDYVSELYRWANLPRASETVATQVAQPAIVTASLAAVAVLDQLDIRADVSVGHSLGELTALHWAGALDRAALLRISTARGHAMAELGSATGAMASLRAGRDDVEALLNGDHVTIAGLNAPLQTVISGEATAVAEVVNRARARGIQATRLPVSHAFHSPLVAAAVPALARQLAQEPLHPLQGTVISTVTGSRLQSTDDLQALLCQQVTAPVRFLDALRQAAPGVDLWIEAGPGEVLSGLAAQVIDAPVLPLDAGGPSLRALLHVAGAAFALGTPVNHSALFARRFTRPFNLDWQPRFFVNPCELAPLPDVTLPDEAAPPAFAPAVDPQIGATSAPADEAATPGDSGSESPAVTALELVRELVAVRAELPATAIRDNSRLLGDLHLNSIAVGKLVSEAARRLGLLAPVAPTEFADATVAEIARALEELRDTQGATLGEDPQHEPAGVDSWIRLFTVEWVEQPPVRVPPDPAPTVPAAPGEWHVFAPPEHPLAAGLKDALAGWGQGVVLCLPPDPDESHLGLLLEAVHKVLEGRDETRLVLVQQGVGAAGVARTLHLEAPWVTTCVVDLPLDALEAPGWVLAEIKAARGYSEVRYDRDGTRRQPVLRLLPSSDEPAACPLGPEDVLLVTGGGKGIAAECALAIARESKVRLALLGRSQPADDAELAANLARLAAEGVTFRYLVADVTDAEAVREAVARVKAELGPVTAILHGAGANTPQLLSELDEAAFRRTLAPKVQGARNVLAAIDPDRLKLLVTFGSIIARLGLRGEADYALANEWLAHLTARWHEAHPHCRCVTAEWSIWSGIGMGERLGRVEALMRAGITPIPPDEGIRALRHLIAQPLPAPAIVVSGRFGRPPTLGMVRRDLPFLRFLERPRVDYPGIELVADLEISQDTDPYLSDHVYRGDALLPAVMGLEAMAQVAIAVTGAVGPITFEEVELDRPVVVSGGQSLTIRLAALVRAPGRVDVVLRSADTGFQVDHFRARCRVGGQEEVPPQELGIEGWRPAENFPPLPVDPQRDLYGNILFHGPRFQRLRSYRVLKATECLAEITPAADAQWFDRYLPSQLVLGDPGMRDAVIHAIQACIPQATLLPTGVQRVAVLAPATPGPRWVHARERRHEGDTFTYDVAVRDGGGQVIEQWTGLRLRQVERKTPHSPWAAPMLAPYIERQVQELIPGLPVTVDIRQTGPGPGPGPGSGPGTGTGTGAVRGRHAHGAQRLLTEGAILARRPDGKPTLVADQQEITLAHSADLTMLVTGPAPLGCDVEAVLPQEASGWRDLLGRDGFALAQHIEAATHGDLAAAATRVWAARECLKKAGAALDAPLVAAQITPDGWALLASGQMAIATFLTTVRESLYPRVFAILGRRTHESL